MAFEGVQRGKHRVRALERSERPFARPVCSSALENGVFDKTLERPSARTSHGEERSSERFLNIPGDEKGGERLQTPADTSLPGAKGALWHTAIGMI